MPRCVNAFAIPLSEVKTQNSWLRELGFFPLLRSFSTFNQTALGSLLNHRRNRGRREFGAALIDEAQLNKLGSNIPQ
jgi:hypothetical protein